MFCFSFDRVVRLEPLSTPWIGGWIRGLLRRVPDFFFPAAFNTFDEWTGPRNALAGCPSSWEGLLLLGRNACPVVGRKTRLPELGRGGIRHRGRALGVAIL